MPGRSEDARAFRRCQGVTVTPGVAGLGRVMRRPHSVSAGGSEGRIALHLARPRGWQGRSAFPSCPPCPPPLPVSSRCAYLSPQEERRSMAGAAPAGLPSLRVHGRAVGGCVGGAMQPAAAAAPAAGPAAAPAAAPTERAAVADVAVGGSARVQSRDWRGERADV
ncbi:unnamed protein product [Closterium sp. NIES-65]|nr:unnamed protein product [Closterium sp. NIES-65]CAI6011179.1 unnamed protein product [Closterium sp. NIES-65]